MGIWVHSSRSATYQPYRIAGSPLSSEPSGYNEGLFFVINEELGHPAMLDVRVRKAIAMGIDRVSMNEDLLSRTDPGACKLLGCLVVLQ